MIRKEQSGVRNWTHSPGMDTLAGLKNSQIQVLQRFDLSVEWKKNCTHRAFTWEGYVIEPVAGRAVLDTTVAQGSGVYRASRAHPGAGNWRKRGHLHAGECGPAEEPSRCRSRSAGEIRQRGDMLRLLWHPR